MKEGEIMEKGEGVPGEAAEALKQRQRAAREPEIEWVVGEGGDL